ncbi:hypothetical protein [Massilia sp. CCM 8734]|uniref:hypothetical protein n=1 Tax=Massilia sp. CCM 8734 TaxID=2609283 RepID=UPI001421517B|nr:hypothetical protein [Massilia sp. CCM 8734]NHZ94598.1 hypothetical protein [Massilia sp. CCM 8734]
MSIITKEGITVKVGQVWRDLDVRTQGPQGGPRMCTVVGVYPVNGYAHMSVNGAQPYRTTRLQIARMHKTTTGWVLVSEPAA